MRTLLQLTAAAATIGAMVVTGYTQSNTQSGGNTGATPGATQGTTQGTGRGTNSGTTSQGTTNSSNTTAGQNSSSSTSASSNSASSSMDAANKLVEMNNAEVALGRTASTKAQNAAVKSYAAMMVKDHSAALTKLKGTSGVTSTEMKPNAKHQATADRLSKLSGAEFDREYMAEMVADHQEALDFLEAQSKSGNSNTTNAGSGAGNTSLAKIASDMIPTVRQHLQQAQKIQKDLTNNTSSSKNSTSKSNTSSNTNSNSGTTTNSGTNNNSNRSGANSNTGTTPNTGTNNNSNPSGTAGNPAGGNR
jgi:putative membrane protein